MDAVSRFREYAAAFEDVVKNDDFRGLEAYFTEDAVYEIVGGPPFAGRHVGRPAILAYLKASLDGFDRRFPTRRLEILEGPELREGGVWFRWRAAYSGPKLPELVLDGVEIATFQGDRIQRLEDRFSLEMSSLTEHWFSHYGSRLSPAA